MSSALLPTTVPFTPGTVDSASPVPHLLAVSFSLSWDVQETSSPGLITMSRSFSWNVSTRVFHNLAFAWQVNQMLLSLNNQWNFIKSVSQPVSQHASVADSQSRVYILGGNTLTGRTDQNLRYNSSSDVWDALAPIPDARSNFGCEIINDQIYVIAGDSSSVGTRCTLLSRYDISTNTWQALAQLGTRRGACLSGKDDQGRIYALGGNDGTFNDTTSCERYDPATDTWTPIAPLNVKASSSYACAVSGGGYIYVIGSTFFGKSIQRYDPNTDAWITLGASSNVDTTVWSSQAVYSDGFIYLFLLANGNGTRKYDVKNAVWSVFTPTLMYLSDSSVALTDNGRFYLVGGTDSNNDILDQVQIYDTKRGSFKWKTIAFPLTKIITFNWAIRNGIVKTSTINWSTYGRLVIQRTFSWHVISGIGALINFLWGTSNNVQESSLFKWETHKFVSKLTSLKWEVGGTLSKLIKLVWNDGARIVRLPKFIWKTHAFTMWIEINKNPTGYTELDKPATQYTEDSKPTSIWNEL